MSKTILYIGGFALPDKNAAAQRVIGVAKGLRSIGHTIIFLNSLKECSFEGVVEKEYFGFKCYEYQRESQKDYLIYAKTTISMIDKIVPDIVIAYNYPSISLFRIKRYCRAHDIRIYADTTEWYSVAEKNPVYSAIKNLDTSFRMYYVNKHLDGIIAISRFLYNYYKNSVLTVLVPPTIDITDNKWNREVQTDKSSLNFIYAGSPDATKERLDLIVTSFEKVCQNCDATLEIVGINKKQFLEIYNWNDVISDRVHFMGRVEHEKAIECVKAADWAIILRDNSRVVNAGFPTKLVEAISCGTPVIINRFSNISDYITEDCGIIVNDVNKLELYMVEAFSKDTEIQKDMFDYHYFLDELERLIK